MALQLTPEKALIFRIIHRDNLPWILDHGLNARNGESFDPNYRNIGHPDLIDRRSRRKVEIPPGGTLSDYVPFYFTPYSIMMLNLTTGYGGVKTLPNDELVIIVSSLHLIAKEGIPFVFTDQHAYSSLAIYHSRLTELDCIDWDLLQRKDFRHDPDDPAKKARYQAEALVWKHVPLRALSGICCHNQVVRSEIRASLDRRGIRLETGVQPRWYFS